MLWFDNDDQCSLEAKLRRAITYYESKFNQRPTVCFMHPSALFGHPTEIAGVTLCKSNSVLPHHFWLGREEQLRRRRAA